MNLALNQGNIIGGDETGVGDYLTPLVVALVFVRDEQVAELQALGVTDSKKLSTAQIKQLFNALQRALRGQWTAHRMSQSQYNFLTSNKKLNAHELKTLLYVNALAALSPRVPAAKAIIIDQYASSKNFDAYVTRLDQIEPITRPNLPVSLVEKGESKYVAIAAASIMARGVLLEMMAEQNAKWKMTFPLGVSASVITAAQNFVQVHGAANLRHVAKLSFKTTSKVLRASSNKAA